MQHTIQLDTPHISADPHSLLMQTYIVTIKLNSKFVSQKFITAKRENERTKRPLLFAKHLNIA